MSSQLLIGAAAAIAGGAYLYNKQNPTAEKQLQQQVNSAVNTLNDQAHAGYNEVKHKIDQGVAGLQNQLDAALASLSDAKTQLQQQINYANDRFNNVTKDIGSSPTLKWINDRAEPYKKDAKEYRYAVTDLLTPESEKPVFTQIVHKYIDLINKVGGAAYEEHPFSPSDEVRRKQWLATIHQDDDDLTKKFANVKAEAQRTYNSWVSWGNSYKDQIKSDYYKQKQKLNSAWDKTTSQVDLKVDEAAYNYEQAKKNLDGVIERADTGHLTQAKKDFNDAYNNLKQFGENVVNDVNLSLKKSV